jgi:plasmid stability protein
MATITVRNIPESIYHKLKMLSELDRRSMNNELLIAIENGVKELESKQVRSSARVHPEAQIKLWQDLCGAWKDKRSKEKQLAELREDRTMGREVSL